MNPGYCMFMRDTTTTMPMDVPEDLLASLTLSKVDDKGPAYVCPDCGATIRVYLTKYGATKIAAHWIKGYKKGVVIRSLGTQTTPHNRFPILGKIPHLPTIAGIVAQFTDLHASLTAQFVELNTKIDADTALLASLPDMIEADTKAADLIEVQIAEAASLIEKFSPTTAANVA